MLKVFIISPYSGKTPEEIRDNVMYARELVKYQVTNGNTAFAPHLLYTQPGILDDSDADQRMLGMNCGQAWISSADHAVVGLDRGLSNGMKDDIEKCLDSKTPIVFVLVDQNSDYDREVFDQIMKYQERQNAWEAIDDGETLQ